jgi:thymidylate synthase ThyX
MQKDFLENNLNNNKESRGREEFQPVFEGLNLEAQERYLIEPFFTNLDRPVFAVPFLPPEIIGALCSRTSRAKDDLRVIFLNEFVKPFLEDGSEYGEVLKNLIDFLHQNPIENIFSNPRAREFYIKWLAQYGDDSIAQMAGTHLVFSGISQVAIKHWEDQRIGLAPIEKSTRYVDYSSKIAGRYRYYTDPTLKKMGLINEYRQAMDNLFITYTQLTQEFFEFLRKKYPEEKELLLKTKTFDTLRGILPSSTLSQVSFFGNGQAFEYAISRAKRHNLGEIRWTAEQAKAELEKVVPAFLRRLDSEEAQNYQVYLGERRQRIRGAISDFNFGIEPKKEIPNFEVKLISYDPEGENKVIAGLIYETTHESFESILEKVRRMSQDEKEKILAQAIYGRTKRFYKVPRGFEMADLCFEIVTNIGAWRDLHRHRMHTQMRQNWSIYHGFDIPEELKESGLAQKFESAIRQVEDVFLKIEKHNPDLAQYATTLAHRLRFLQKQNMRAFFWETELRTIPAGHPDYRKVEQEKVKLVKNIYPLLTKYLLADMNQYDFARRGAEEQARAKQEELENYFQNLVAKNN